MKIKKGLSHFVTSQSFISGSTFRNNTTSNKLIPCPGRDLFRGSRSFCGGQVTLVESTVTAGKGEISGETLAH